MHTGSAKASAVRRFDFAKATSNLPKLRRRREPAREGRRHNRASTVAGLVVFLTFGALRAEAQICAGRASFNIAPTHVELDAGTNKSGRGIGVSAGHGRDAVFVIVSGATHSISGSGSAHSIVATLASDQPLSPDNKLHVCPMVSVGYVSDAGGATGQSGRVGASVAADASMLAVNTPRLKVMPTIGLDLRYNGVGRTVGLFAQDASRDGNTFSAGLGFVLSNRLSIVPRVVVPFGPLDQSGLQLTIGYSWPVN